MAQENAEIVRSIAEALNRRDWDAVFRHQHPDVELLLPDDGFASGTYRGRDQCQGYWEEIGTAFEAWTVQFEEILERGGQIVATVRTRARPNGSSVEFEIRNGALWTIRDGTIVSVEVFKSPEEALEAVGLTR